MSLSLNSATDLFFCCFYPLSFIFNHAFFLLDYAHLLQFKMLTHHYLYRPLTFIIHFLSPILLDYSFSFYLSHAKLGLVSFVPRGHDVLRGGASLAFGLDWADCSSWCRNHTLSWWYVTCTSNCVFVWACRHMLCNGCIYVLAYYAHISLHPSHRKQAHMWRMSRSHSWSSVPCECHRGVLRAQASVSFLSRCGHRCRPHVRFFYIAYLYFKIYIYLLLFLFSVSITFFLFFYLIVCRFLFFFFKKTNKQTNKKKNKKKNKQTKKTLSF